MREEREISAYLEEKRQSRSKAKYTMSNVKIDVFDLSNLAEPLQHSRCRRC